MVKLCTDSVDQQQVGSSSGRSMSYIGRIRHGSVRGSRGYGGGTDNESKLAFGRSRSMVDTTDSSATMGLLPGGANLMTSADSESTFYSCNSEQELEEKSRLVD